MIAVAIVCAGYDVILADAFGNLG